MKAFLATTIIVAGALLAGGCATKKYVRNTAAPIQAKVDQVGEQTTKNGQAIEQNKTELTQEVKQVDDKAQAGIGSAKEAAQTADNHAGEAMNKANQANDAIAKTNQDLSGLRQVVANLDDYKESKEV